MSDARDRAGTLAVGKLAIGLLGPLELRVDGRAVPLATGRLPTLLAVLAMAAGGPVPVDRLSAALWGGAPPNNARRSAQTYLARLRATLPAGSIHTMPVGYLLRVDPDDVDALRFLRLLDVAAGAPDPVTERARLADALALWRGSPFEGLGSDWLAQTEAPRLLERYLSGLERRVDLDLRDGRHRELVPELRHLTGRHPLRESLGVRLLAALDRGERHAEALAEYQAVRVRLAGELGVDPGPQLRQAHADLLAGRPVLAATAPASGGPASGGDGRPVPRQLPADIDGFVGREPALAALDELLAAASGAAASGSGPVPTTAIAGTAGIGKTTLAVHWAHLVAHRFPDGQLYVNLRGFDPSGQAMDPGEAVRGFLDALGVPPQHLPAGLAAQTGRYRSLLAGRRVLVLLDNARDADQVRPLLPGSPGCLVVITSRDQLPGLVATEGARPLTLELLPVDESRQLLTRQLGKDRVAAEPDAVGEIVTSCAGLPLALAIAAGRATTRPAFPLASVAAELRAARTGLDAFATGDSSTDARAVFSWSYRALAPATARLFRLLGLHPGPELSRAAAASLAGLPVPRTAPLLAELCRAHLLTEPAPGRYACHDLLRAYATELVHVHEPEPDRHAARHRLLDHYLHTGYAAAGQLNQHRDMIALAPPHPGTTVEELSGREAATAWFGTEKAGLLAAVAGAADAGFDRHAWQLAWTLADFLHRSGAWHDWSATQHIALDAARRGADRDGQALAHGSLANVYTWLGRLDQARAHSGHALDLYRQLGDRSGQARTHHNLASILELQDRLAEALDHAERSAELHQAGGHRTGHARALNAVGWCQARLGDHRQALRSCRQALALAQEVGDRPGEAATWDSLGYVHQLLGQHAEAVSCYQHSLTRYRELGNRYPQARTLVQLGDVHRAAGDPGAARDHWRQALAILDELNHPDAEPVRAKLAGTAAATAGFPGGVP